MKSIVTKNIIISLVLLIITVVNYILSVAKKNIFFRYYRYISVHIIKFLSLITSFVSFSLWEIICALILIFIMFLIYKGIKEKRIIQAFSKIFLILIIITTSFVNIWGLNYFAPKLIETLDYDEKSYNENDLYNLTFYLVEKANEYADKVNRDIDVNVIIDVENYNENIKNGYRLIKNKLPFFINTEIEVKTLLSSRYFSKRGTIGIFMPLTGESSITDKVYCVSVPFTMTHEIAHRNAIAREDEANFIGFIACIENEKDEFKYSGYFNAFLYCASNLVETNPNLYMPIKEKINDNLRSDIINEIAFYDKIIDRQKEDKNNELYSHYLDAFDIKNGVESYSDIVEYLLKWYFEEMLR